MTDWTWVRDKETGHQYPTAVVNPEAHEVLNKPATDRFGNPLPAKPYLDLSSRTIPELHAYAEEHQIDLGGASKKDDILAAVDAHEQGDDTPAA